MQDLETALEIDPELGLAYSTLAWIHELNWRAAEAQEANARARELRPNDPEILLDSALLIYSTGASERLEDFTRRAFEIDPGSHRAHELMCQYFLEHDDVDTAIDYLRKATELAPTAAIYHTNLAIFECVRGDFATALTEARIAEGKFQGNANMAQRAIEAYAYGRAGSREDAERLFRQVKEAAATRRVPPVAWIFAYLAIGDNEQALHWLEVLAENQVPYESFFGVNTLALNWYREPVLEQPEFAAVRKRVGFQA